MTITFFSNFFNHHQKPICDLLYQRLGDKFCFVSTMPMPESFASSGYADYSNIDYNLLSYDTEENHAKAKLLGFQSDIVMFGTSAPLEFLKDRFLANKHTFRYSERIFKKGNYQKFDYRVIIGLLKSHTRFRNKNVYMLCASAFTANDFKIVGAYPNKLFKWGYFTKVEKINVEEIIKNKSKKKIKILYVSRLIKWKHPELAIQMAKELRLRNISFELQIIGTGPMSDWLKAEVDKNNLNSQVTFLGNLPNIKVIEKMRGSHIFIFTSDRNEGWGAVLNEAMSNGCSVVVSNRIGSSPYLINNGKNGLVFKSGDSMDLTDKVERLILDLDLRNELARNAYKTMSEIWSPKNATDNFLLLCQSLIKNEKIKINEGPCTIASPTSINWYKD